MKYAITYVVIIIILMIGSFLIANRILKGRDVSKGKRILLRVGICLLFITVFNIGFLQIYYHADETAQAALDGSETVTVTREGDDYFFDGPGEDTAIAFIPGARVEETAYAPLLCRISEQGVDCFLIKVPNRMAIFGMNAPDRAVRKKAYKNWYLMGHSLGGIVAAAYAGSHAELVDGVIVLASYPTVELPDTLSLLSIYGSRDGCMNMQRHEASKTKWPPESSDMIIDGGNHSGFGNYGLQRGDKEASMGSDDQQAKTTEIITEFLKEPG